MTPSTALYMWVYTAQFTFKERLAKHTHGNIYIQTAISPMTQMTKTCVLPLFRLFEVLIKWSIIQSTNFDDVFPYHVIWPSVKGAWEVETPGESGIPFRTQPKYFTRLPTGYHQIPVPPYITYIARSTHFTYGRN